MTQRRSLGLWLPLAVVAALPMCESSGPSEPNESSAAAGGGGDEARAVAGETSVIPGAAGLGNDSPSGGVGGVREGETPAGAGPVTGTGGYGGWSYDDPGPKLCGPNDDGLPCCITSQSCTDLPAAWCEDAGNGGNGEGPPTTECCDNGQRQACLYEQGESAGWYPSNDTCTCSNRKCVCENGVIP